MRYYNGSLKRWNVLFAWLALLCLPNPAHAQSALRAPHSRTPAPRPLVQTTQGGVFGWGLNSSGQLGDNLTTDSDIPTGVLGVGGIGSLTGVKTVAVGADFTVAVDSSGNVWAWGDNSGGELGNGTTTNSSTPIQVPNLTDITAIAVGDNSCVALRADGTVWAWGEDDDGECGNGEMGTDVHTPTRVLGPGGVGYLTGITAIAASDYTVAALRYDGTVWMWGDNEYGELGNGTTTNGDTPTQVYAPTSSGYLDGITSLAVTFYTVLALRYDGTVWAWGNNLNGQLGNNSTNDSSTAVQVVNPSDPGGFLTNIASIAALEYNSYAVSASGEVYVWGHNYSGELGNGVTSTLSSVPSQVLGPGGVGYLTGITAVVPFYDGSLALGNDGMVWAWGLNLYGELGHAPGTDGDTGSGFGPWNTLPTQVLGPNGTGFLTGVTSLAAGFGNCFAILDDGTVWTWGDNTDCQLGDGSTADASFPTQAVGLTGAVSLFVGASDTFAISETQTVSGGILLQGEVPAAPSQPISLAFTSMTTGATYAYTEMVGPDGAFSLPGILPGAYKLAIKGSKWLQRDMLVDTTSGPVTNVNAALLVGDINNDNVIDINDFGLLAAAYGTSPGSADWNANADLNGDGVVDINDFGLLASNFGLAGDP